MCFTVHIIFVNFDNHSPDLGRDICLAPEGFQRSISGLWTKKVVHHWRIATCACMCAYVHVCVFVCMFVCVHMCMYVFACVSMAAVCVHVSLVFLCASLESAAVAAYRIIWLI